MVSKTPGPPSAAYTVCAGEKPSITKKRTRPTRPSGCFAIGSRRFSSHKSAAMIRANTLCIFQKYYNTSREHKVETTAYGGGPPKAGGKKKIGKKKKKN